VRTLVSSAFLFFFVSLMLAPVSAAEPSPSILYVSLLNGVKIEPSTGKVRLGGMHAVFLPQAERRPGGLHPYNPDGGEDLHAILSGADGTPLGRFSFWVEDREKPWWFLSHYRLTDLRTEEELGQLGELQLEPGQYVLDFFVKGERFHSFAFGVGVVGDDDPFGGGDLYFLDGPWRDWGYIHYVDGDRSSFVLWKAWMRHRGPVRNDLLDIDVELRRTSEGDELVATSNPNVSYRLGARWERVDFDLVWPEGDPNAGSIVRAEEILADGSYSVTMAVAGEPYGVWTFDLVDGKIVPEGRTVRSEADPITFIEGGVDAFWVERGK